jgi:FkbM family methyltransferase
MNFLQHAVHTFFVIIVSCVVFFTLSEVGGFLRKPILNPDKTCMCTCSGDSKSEAPGLIKSGAVEYQEHPLNIINPYKKSFNSYNCTLLTSKTMPPYQVCIHNISWDNGISKYFKDYGSWESYYMPNFKKLLGAYPNMGFFDIGANIGAYTLQAAAMGHLTVAVEPTDRHMGALCESVMTNKFDDRVVLIKNAISDGYYEYASKFSKTHNQGAAQMVKYAGHGNILKSVTLNDLVQAASFKRAVMKIDIEGHEDLAMRKAGDLFKRIFIPYVMMEWVFYRNVLKNATRANWIMDTMSSYGYFPYTHAGKNMEGATYRYLGPDVVWTHKSARRIQLNVKNGPS